MSYTINYSQKCINLVKECEGVEMESYQDSAGIWTIGYGHTGEVKKGDKITKEQAENFLKNDLATAEKSILNLVTKGLTQNQHDALVSFVFNVGYGNFKESSLLEKLNSGDYSGVALEFERWVHVDKKPLEGLVKRRKLEKKLFMDTI